eukprot:1158792-Pelagomonas_calceolata.AAC.1
MKQNNNWADVHRLPICTCAMLCAHASKCSQLQKSCLLCNMPAANCSWEQDDFENLRMRVPLNSHPRWMGGWMDKAIAASAPLVA